MAFVRDHINEDHKASTVVATSSSVSPKEKQALYDGLYRSKPRKTIDRRTAVLMLISAAFGFLAAVFAIRLFPL